MTRLPLKVVLLATVLLITGMQPCLAEQRDAKQAYTKTQIQNYTQNKDRTNYAGWEGILFYCYVNDKKSTEALQSICERTSTNAKFLAASAKIDFQIANDLVQVGFESSIGERLILLVDTFGSSNAIAATTRAYTGFSGPIKTMRKSTGGTREHTSLRSGDLILWE